MYSSPELVALIQHQRERALADERIARQLACMAARCSNTFGDRLARALRLAPTHC